MFISLLLTLNQQVLNSHFLQRSSVTHRFYYSSTSLSRSQISVPCGIPLLPQANTESSNSGAAPLIVCYLVFLCHTYSGHKTLLPTSSIVLSCLSTLPAETSLFPPLNLFLNSGKVIGSAFHTPWNVLTLGHFLQNV